MNKNLSFTLLFCLLVFLLKSQVSSYTIQPGAAGYDASLVSGNPTTNFGTDVNFSAGTDGSGVKTRGLLRFDLSTIPSDAIISSAKLTLFGLSHSGTNPCYLKQNTISWIESVSTWSISPATTPTGQLSLDQSTTSSQTYTLNVKSFVQSMVATPSTNYGWTLIKQNEASVGSLVFGSGDNSNFSVRPLLEISYYIPLSVKAKMIPATGSVSATGGLDVTVTGGVPPYSYLWSDASISEDIASKIPAVYTLTVTDNIGNQFQKDLIIAAENTTMTFTITPNGLSGKDALIQRRDNGTLADVNIKDHALFQAQRGTASGWFVTRGLIEFDLFSLPSNATINSATLNLIGNGHYYPRSNASSLFANTSPWKESSVTWNNQPTHTSTNSLSLPATTSTTQNFALNVTSQVQSWVENPHSNFGWKLMLTDEVTANYAYMIFGSGDNATISLRPNLVISITIPSSSDALLNWQLEETYDQDGNVITSTKVYSDNLGRTTQVLTQDATGDVFATQTIYDSYGRPAIQSLPAYAGNTLSYKSNFMLNASGIVYNYNNFDVVGKVNTPDAIQTGTANTLGTYYSDYNTIDLWQATATNPYHRTHYMANPYNEVKTVNGPDNAFKAGTGRETRSYSMVCGDELKFILGAGNSYKVKVGTVDPMTSTASTIAATSYIKASKSIVTSPDNKEVVSYSIGDKVVATCMSGLPSPDNCSMTSIKNYMDWYGTKSIDIHIPDANKSSLSFPLPTYKLFGATTYTVSNANISYTITDMSTETVLISGTDYILNTTTRAISLLGTYASSSTGKPLFLRVRFDYSTGFIELLNMNSKSLPAGIVQYNLDYGRWSVNYYDFAGNLRKVVSPKGINCGSPGTITQASTYDYSHLRQAIATKTPDEGLTEVAYNTNGQPRFTQNPEQKLNKRFSYVHYDLHGRVTEKGEFSNLSGSGINGSYFQNYYGSYTAPYTNNVATNTIIDNFDGLSDTYCNDVSFTSYEELSSGNDIPTAYTYSAAYLGKYKNGQVSKTWNANTSTWYKYDVAGRLFATIKKVNDADYSSYGGNTADLQIKTFENSYDPYFGYVTNSYFQKNVLNEYAEHRFSFDVNRRISGVSFATAGDAAFNIETLSYDKLGRLKRKVLGPDLQGIDFVYTINGALKAINHPSLDYTKDRGNDLRNYNDANTGVKQDLFGEILEYFPSDYIRAGTSIESNTNGLYNGQIYGMRYKTRNDVNGTVTGANYIDYLGSNSAMLISNTNYGTQEFANRYTYDSFGQLATSTFGTFTNTINGFTARTDYKEFGVTNNSIAYDANGNITRLKRNSYNVAGSAVLLDDLTYTISATGNNHTKVADASANSFSSSFNYKNPTGIAQNFTYNANGQLTSSPDESITAISYYPNGQIKQITFANGNITNHYYDDQGQRYKTKYFSSATSSTKYTWFVFGTVYEYVSTVGTFSLKEMNIGGTGRVGVYKQDVAGIAISSGHAEYELTDHLGNVRVTFRQGTGTNLDVLSKADYYSFGGQLPGRIWQQSGGEYRYGYQGQEKSQNDVNWDNFELRSYNHDLGRWSTPDPYNQFHSPYLAMANNPVSKIDPDGGYVTQPRWQASINMNRQAYGLGKVSFGPLSHLNVSYSDFEYQGIDGPESMGSSGGGGVSSIGTSDYDPFQSDPYDAVNDLKQQGFEDKEMAVKSAHNMMAVRDFIKAEQSKYTEVGKEFRMVGEKGVRDDVFLGYYGKDEMGNLSRITKADVNMHFFDLRNIENGPRSQAQSNGGATVYIENDGIGHAYLEVNGTVFSYGRYDGSYSPSSGAFGPVGPGVLLKKDHSYATERMAKSPTSVYKFPNANANTIYKYLNNAYNAGTPSKHGGMVIDTYMLLGNNCTTMTCGALQVGGVDIPWLNIPSEFNTFMQNPNFYNINNNWLYK